MIKKMIFPVLSILLVLFLAAPVSVIPAEECSCNSSTSITALDLKCKTFCGEFIGQGTCVGWELLESDCAPGAFCNIKWRIICANGSSTTYTTFDSCFQCPFFEDPGSGGGNNTQTTMPTEPEPEPDPDPKPESESKPKSAESSD